MTATVLSVIVAVVRDGQIDHVHLAGAFDPIRTAEAARTCGRAIGELLSDNLERRIRHGEDLATGTTP